MARELTTIQQEIITELVKNGISVAGSRTSIRRIWTYVMAFCAWTLEKFFDLHKAEIDTLIAKEKASSLQWYREMALRFQYGQALIPDSNQYNNDDLTSEQIEVKRIIKQAAVTAVNGRLRLKVVTKQGENFVQLILDQKKAFEEYMNRVKDAGEYIKIESLPPDQLKLAIDVYYNPLVLDSNGRRIDASSPKPVPDAIRAYLKNLPFNGEYATTRLLDALQKVDGVSLVNVKSAQRQYDLLPYISIDEKYIPDAGYLELKEENLTINYKEYVQS